MKQGAILLTVLVLAHHIIAFVHGGAHNDLAIMMSTLQNAFINIIIVALPFVGAVLLWTRYRNIGLYAIIVGMVGALVFGVYHHYMFESPDHISHLPASPVHVHKTFIWTAGTLAIFEGICTAVASYLLGRNLRMS